MTRREFVVSAGVAVASIGIFGLSGCDTTKTTASGIKVFYGSIYTGGESPIAEALVIKDGKVEYCGTADGAKKYESGAEVTKLESAQLLVPGLIDAHCHPAMAWDNKLNSANFDSEDTLDDYKAKLREYIASNPNKDGYRAKGWLDSRFENGIPTADILDEICPDKPIVAVDSGGHGSWCNTKALEIFFAEHPELKKVDPDNPGHDIAAINGGTIERDSEGNPLGCFRDTATVRLQKILPIATKEDYLPCVDKSIEEYASLGYTSYLDAYVNESADITQFPKAEAYMQRDGEGKLPLYVNGAFIVGNRDDSLELVDKAIELYEKTRGGHFQVTDIKIFMDGVVEGSSAWLEEEYADEPGFFGSATWSTEDDLAKLTKIVEKANEAGMAVHFHAIGDRASVEALNCIEKAANGIGADKVRNARNVITHLQLVNDNTYARFLEYNVVANLSPWGEKDPDFYEMVELTKLGAERAEREYPIKTFLDKGIKSAFGTDYGSSFTYEPGVCLHSLVTRTDKNLDPATCLRPSECIAPEEALALMTRGGAYQMKQEDVLGTLEAGKVANLVILDKNPLEIPADELVNVKAIKTMVDGSWLD